MKKNLIILILAATTALITSCGMQRAYSVNYDSDGNISGGVTITPIHQAK